MSKQDRLISLEARMDAQLHEFGYSNSDEESGAGRKVGAVAVGGAAIGAGAYGGKKLRNAVINRAGVTDDYGSLVARKGMYKDAAKQAGSSAVASGKGLVKKGAMGTADQLAKVGGKGGVFRNVAGKIKVAARGLSAADVEKIAHLAERVALLEMEAEEDLIEFKEYGEQRSPVGVAMIGGRMATKAQEKFKNAGHVYRKRDAYADSVKGNMSGNVLALGGAAAGVLGSRAIIRGAASGKIPKGMLRKGAVKTAQVLKRAGRNKGALIGGMAATSVGGALAGLKLQGRSADKRLARRQAQA